jgi:hypothetical protein
MLLFFGMNHNVQDQKHLHQAAGCLGTQKKKNTRINNFSTKMQHPIGLLS